MLAPIRHIIPITNIARDRVLPKQGKVVVRRGQKVAAGDVIAECVMAPAHLILDLGMGLGLPDAQAKEHLQRKPGEQVEVGDIIAGPVGIARRVVRAPKAGKIILTEKEQVLLEMPGKPFELRAGYSGVVTDLVADRGVRIETTGALIQGVWGNGRMDAGGLSLLGSSPSEVLSSNRLDISMRGSVGFCGIVESADVFRTAAEVPLRGLIIGSMPASLVPTAQKCPVPIVILEGFGRLPVNQAAFKLLSTSERREAMVIADSWNPLTGARPEVVIGLPQTSDLPFPSDSINFETGQTVRVVRQPYTGSIGILQSILPGKSILPNGVRADAAEIRLENGDVVVLPLANLEVLM